VDLDELLKTFLDDPQSLRHRREASSDVAEIEAPWWTWAEAEWGSRLRQKPHRHCRKNDQVEVGAVFPDGDSLSLSSRVAWLKAGEASEYFLGLVFLELDADA